MKERIGFLMQATKPRNASGPCDWLLQVVEDEKGQGPVFIKGTFRTYQEARGLTSRIDKALMRAYRLGVKHGRKPLPVKNVIPFKGKDGGGVRVILFQDQFAEKVREGSKRQTIRQTARCKVGDWVSLRRWTGKPYRSKQEVLRTDVCTAVMPVRVDYGVASVGGVVVDGQDLAALDGFKDCEEMRDWFGATHGLPFLGWLIEWSGVDDV